MKLLLIITLCCLFILQSFGQDGRAVSVINKANEKLNQIDFVSYDYTYDGDGKLNGKFKGQVKLWKKEPYLASYIYAKIDFIDGRKKDKTWVITVKNGEILLFDNSSATLKSGSLQGGSMSLMTYAYYAVLFQYLQEEPFKNELKNETLQWVGEEKINGMTCEVVKSQNAFGDWISWYIGKKDGLIYAQETVNQNDKTEGSFLFKIKNLVTNKELKESDFIINYGEDVEKINEDEKLIVAGNPAPSWQIESKEGNIITSQNVKGKIVILDFWASWCNPCWKIMPEVNAIAEKYQDDNLFVLGVNVWENPTRNPYTYFKENNYNYQSVVDQDAQLALNFKVGFLPVLVLIDEAGIIRYVSNGYTESLSDDLENEIDKLLE